MKRASESKSTGENGEASELEAYQAHMNNTLTAAALHHNLAKRFFFSLSVSSLMRIPDDENVSVLLALRVPRC